MQAMTDALSMLITGALPIVAISSGLGAIIAARQQHTRAAAAMAVVSAVGFAASAWVYSFVFPRLA
jgi:hypothetical protein